MRFHNRDRIQRQIALVILVCLAASTAACVDESRIEELEAQNAELQERVHELESGIETLRTDLQEIDETVIQFESAADELDGDVSRFHYDDWGEVVPDVISDSSDMSNAVGELRMNVDLLDRHLSGL